MITEIKETKERGKKKEKEKKTARKDYNAKWTISGFFFFCHHSSSLTGLLVHSRVVHALIT